MKALIGTKNPGKIKGATDALNSFFEGVEVVGIPVPSDVPDQPVNNETLIGAQNRVNNLISYAKENNIEYPANADIFIPRDHHSTRPKQIYYSGNFDDW